MRNSPPTPTWPLSSNANNTLLAEIPFALIPLVTFSVYSTKEMSLKLRELGGRYNIFKRDLRIEETFTEGVLIRHSDDKVIPL